MDEPVRLACPNCELVYRLKKLTPGKAYTCKNCGGPLLSPDTLVAGEEGRISVATSLAQPHRAPAAGASAPIPESSSLSRLPRMIEELTERIDALKALELSDGEDSPAAVLMRMNERLDEDLRHFSDVIDQRLRELEEKVPDTIGQRLRELEEKLPGDIDGNLLEVRDELRKSLGEIDEKVSAALQGNLQSLNEEMAKRVALLDEKLSSVSDKANRAAEAAASRDGLEELRRHLGEQFREHRESIAKNLDDRYEAQKKELQNHHAEQKKALDALLAPLERQSNTTVEVDIDELADRLVAGVRSHSHFLNPDEGSAVDAMARLAGELVKEQSENSTKLDELTKEIRTATAGIAMMEEWRGELPERVADEIGQTVEARVVGPISGALARQAPSILSDLQDTKLVDIVSRSVREAQRPLLREILSGNRGGIPVWLFASVLLPLLLILGYLFLPGEYGGMGGSGGASGEVADSLARIESGMHSVSDTDARLQDIEDVVLDIHDKALAHAKNAASLEKDVEYLKSALAASKAETEKYAAEIEKYNKVVEAQTKRQRELEMQLMQLGVSPSSVGSGGSRQ